MSGAGKAVFLSYASQDAEAARRICEALCAAGIEVWFDQSELRGGDAWDAKIRRQIKECALFLPVISANTQSRTEGYFRLEWKLAALRTYAFADGTPFLLPVVIDATQEDLALVPEEFRAVQWTRATGGQMPASAVANLRLLLGQPGPQASPRVSPSRGADPPRSAGPSIAVLAFANLSRDPENEYFSDGISEELLNVLAKIPGLKVAARTSAFFFKGRNVPIPEIARTLGVAHVVEGSVRKMGNRVRITAQLIDARDGFHLWSENFDRELQDIFAVQDEIAGLIARNLQLKLSATNRAARVVDPEAHRLVLEGRHFWTLRTEAGFARAEQAFTRALDIDPDFAPAHAGLADVSVVRAWYLGLGDGGAYQQDLKRAAAALQQALALDPSLAESHAATAVVNFLESRWDESEREFQEALRLNPNYAVAHHWHAHLLAGRGDLGAALAALERSIALDPLSVVTLVIYASQLNFARRYEDVLAITDRALALRSTVIAPLHGARALALLALGRNDEALAAARIVTQEETWWMRWWAAEEALFVLKQAGAAGEANAILGRWEANLPADSLNRGLMLHAVGRFDDALPFLENMVPSLYSRFHFQTIWDDVRDDPRFHALLQRLGCAAAYQRGREGLARMLAGRGMKP